MDQGPSGARGLSALIGEAIDRFTPLLWIVVVFTTVGAITAMLAPSIQALVWTAVVGLIVVVPVSWLFDQLRERAWGEIGVAAIGMTVLAALIIAALSAMTLLARFFY